MKTKFKKILSLVLAIVMVVAMMPMTAFAADSNIPTTATYEDVDTFAKLQQAFEDTADEVQIVITGNIDNAEETYLVAGEDQTYTIERTDFVLTDMRFRGIGTVVVNATIEGKQDDALILKDSVTVTVDGDIDGKENDGINADDSAIVKVTGTVRSDTSDGVDADDYSQVTVIGNVYGGSGADGVDASDESKVTVYGDVYGGDGQAPDAEGNLYSGNINDPDGYSDGGAGVEADKYAEVYVDGGVYGGDSYGTNGYAGAGIDATDYAKVSITGNAVGGDQIANPDVVPEKETDPEGNEYAVTGYGGDGVLMDSTNHVMVSGDALGGVSNAHTGLAGCGAYIVMPLVADVDTDSDPVSVVPNIPGELTVKGSLIGGEIKNESGLPGNAIYFSGSDWNPAKDGMLPDEFIEQIAANEDTSYLRNAVQSMAAICYEAGGYYMDHETSLKYQNQYVEKIISLAAAYGVDTDSAINSYVPETGSIDTKEIQSLKAVVNAVPEEKLKDFVKAALKLGNEVLDSTDIDMYVIPSITAGGLAVKGEEDLVEGDPGFNDQFIPQIIADYLTIKHTVTYKADGVVVDTQTVIDGEDATAPAIPEKVGYTQTAPIWDKDGKNITADTEINAVYTADRYSVTFDANGGAAIAPATVIFGEKYGSLPSSAITGLSGGNKNWYLVDADGNVTETNIKNLTLVSAVRDHKLFIKRNVLAPSVSVALTVPGGISDGYQYYIPGASKRVLTASIGNMNTDILEYTYQWYKDGTLIEGATSNVLTLDGNVSDSGTYKVDVTAKLKDGTNIVVTSDTSTASKEQKVKILHATNTLSYDANGGESGPQSSYTGGTALNVSKDVPTRAHYDFIGWNTAPDGTGDSYKAEEVYTFANDNGNGGCEVTLYAQWKLVEYTVTYKADGEPISIETVGHGNDATLPVVPAKAGYVGKWDRNNENITADTEINAVYTKLADVPDDFKPEDKTDLEDTKAKLEEMLKDDGYTEDAKKDIQEAIDDIDDALEVIGNVENVEDLIGKIPDTVTKDDEDDIKAADNAFGALTDKEKALVSPDVKKALEDAKAALEKLKKPVSNSDSAQTGDNSNMFLWLALLFISGGTVITLTVVDRKKRAER